MKPPGFVYLTGVSGPAIRAAGNRRDDLALLVTPNNGLHKQIAHFAWWAAENGCFNAETYVGDSAFLGWLEQLPRRRCLFAVAPDVLADAAATWERSREFLPLIRLMGYPAALVAQNGWHDVAVEWDEFDVLFIGGDDAFKLHPSTFALCDEARARGKWVHMGRVNTRKRITTALAHCNSVDGTTLGFGPDKNLRQLEAWLDQGNLFGLAS